MSHEAKGSLKDSAPAPSRSRRQLEFDATDKISISPAKPETERYMTGRFG